MLDPRASMDDSSFCRAKAEVRAEIERGGSMPGTTDSGNRALVTGAARGIGKAIALALAEAGARVAVNYRQRER